MTVTERGVQHTLGKCAAYDPMKFPQRSEAILMAWVEHFAKFPSLTDALLLEAVSVYYELPDRKVPQPADISRIARDLRQRRTGEESEHEKNLRIAANEERIGLPPEDRTFPNGVPTEDELLALTTSDERRSAITQFARRVAGLPGQQPDLPKSELEIRAAKVAKARSGWVPPEVGGTSLSVDAGGSE